MSRIAAAMLIAALPLAACSESAEAAMRNYSVTGFDRMRIAGPFDVHVRVGSNPSVHATGPKDALDRLAIEQNGDTLVVKTLPGGWGGWPNGTRGPVVVDVTTQSLRAIAVTGSGDITVDRVQGDALDLAMSGSGSMDIGAVDVGAFSATMTGSGDLSAKGKARTARATLTGTGDLKADGLVSDDAQVNLVGSGDLSLGARHNAKVVLTGSGDVTIAGPAACAITRSGSGDVRCAHQSRD